MFLDLLLCLSFVPRITGSNAEVIRTASLKSTSVLTSQLLEYFPIVKHFYQIIMTLQMQRILAPFVVLKNYFAY